MYRRTLLFCLLLSLLSACTSGGTRPFSLKNIAKSDIDMVTDAHIAELDLLARQLMIKLYKRNPRELHKAPPGTTLEKRIKQLFGLPRTVRFAELGDHYANTAVPLAFADDFTGDRVFALMVGLTGMIHRAYNFQSEFYLLDSLDQQKLYNCARNLEATAWQLSNRRDTAGRLYLHSNAIDFQSGRTNLSFERIFGKLISLQDMMARIVADKNNRTINQVVHGVASTTLLPI